MPVPSDEFEPASSSLTYLSHGHNIAPGLPGPTGLPGTTPGLHFNYAYGAPRAEPLTFHESFDASSFHRYSPPSPVPVSAPLGNDFGVAFPPHHVQNGNDFGVAFPPHHLQTGNDFGVSQFPPHMQNGLFQMRDQFLSHATVPKPSVGIGMHLGLTTASELFDRFDQDRNGSLPVEELLPCAEALWKALHYGAGELPLKIRYALQTAMEEKIVAPGASFVEFGEFVAWYEECVERITPPQASGPVSSPPLHPMQPHSDPLPGHGGSGSLGAYSSVLRPASWGPSAGDSPYGIRGPYDDRSSAFPSSSQRMEDGQLGGGLSSMHSLSQALPQEQPGPYGQHQYGQYGEQPSQPQAFPQQLFQDPSTGQLYAAAPPVETGGGQGGQYGTGEGSVQGTQGPPGALGDGAGATGSAGPQAQGGVSQAQLQQGKLVYVPNPQDPNGPPQLVLQIPAAPSPVLSSQADAAGVPPLSPARHPAPASPSSPPSLDTTPQPAQSIQTQTSPPPGQPPTQSPTLQPSAPPAPLPPSSYSPVSVAASAAPPSSAPLSTQSSAPLPPRAQSMAPAAPPAVPPVSEPGAQAAAPAAPAAPSESGDSTFLCDFHCGFSGSFEAVSMHEANCVFNPVNGGAGAGLVQPPSQPAGMAQPAYSKRMRLSQQVTPMTPVMEGGEDEDERGSKEDAEE